MAVVLRFLSTGLTWSALILHLVICACYLRRWDKVAAITIFPFWAWAGLGALMAGIAWIIARRRLAAGICALWIITLAVGSDETVPLLRLRAEKPQPGLPAPVDGRQPLRIATLNCRAGMWHPESLRDLAPWQPDIVFLQEAPTPLDLQKFASQLYAPAPGYSEGGFHCGIIARGPISGALTGWQPASILAKVEWKPGKWIELACVHLKGAETTLKIWDPNALRSHRDNRQSRRSELGRLLSAQQFVSQREPAIIGGDFNAPAGDAVFDLLKEAGFRDAFAAAGSGWPNTYPNSAPVLRIDHLWVNSRITPARAAAVTTKYSDHRMVVCDFLVD